MNELISSITVHLPGKDTRITVYYGVINPSLLPATPEESIEMQYGEKEILELGQHYGREDPPFVSADDLLTEWG